MIVALWLAACSAPDSAPPPAAPVVAPGAIARPADVAAPPAPPARYGLGKPADPAAIAAWDRDVSPTAGWPPGRGDVATGAQLYRQKCLACHGVNGEGGVGPLLFAPNLPQTGFGDDPKLAKTVGNFWPYTSTLFDYIRRAMPQNAPGSLTDDEVYALSAYLLERNGVVDAQFVADATTMPAVTLPGLRMFVPDDREATPAFR